MCPQVLGVTSIIYELLSLGEDILRDNIVGKILGILPPSWDSEVNGVIDIRNLKTIPLDDLIGKVMT